MKSTNALLIAVSLFTLSGCLEVEQHPGWVNGKYAGKPDDLQYQRNFHSDRLAWWARISDRNADQNEYGRARPGDVAPVTGTPPAASEMEARMTGSGATGPAAAGESHPDANAMRPSTAAPTGAAPAAASGAHPAPSGASAGGKSGNAMRPSTASPGSAGPTAGSAASGDKS
jgi:hypothetical protein